MGQVPEPPRQHCRRGHPQFPFECGRNSRQAYFHVYRTERYVLASHFPRPRTQGGHASSQGRQRERVSTALPNILSIDRRKAKRLAANTILSKLISSELIRRLVPKDQLLDVKLEDGFGWEQICPFLGIPIPEEKYPRGNAPAEFDKMLGSFIGSRLTVTAFKVLGSLVIPAVAIGAWYYTKRR